MPPSLLPFVKRVVSKEHVYLYFDTGQRKPSGAKIYKRLPDASDPRFGTAYAACVAIRTKRAKREGRMTVPALIALYRKSPHYTALRPQSRRLYENGLAMAELAFRIAPADELQRSDIYEQMDRIADRPATANAFARTIGALYKWARDRGHVPTSCEPTRDVKFFDIGEYEPWPDHILEQALADPDDFIRLAVKMLYFTGQRVGDVRQARWLELRDGQWPMVQEKTKKPLTIPLHRDLQVELAKHPRSLSYVFMGQAGKPMSYTAFHGKLHRWLAERRCKRTPHGLRKNAVEALLEAECSMAETAAITGQSLQMVEHYAKRRNQERLGKAAMLKFEKKSDAGA